MGYNIRITYDTGDSFKTERGLEMFLDGTWNDLSVATENLNRIKEHYCYYEATNKTYFYNKQEKLETKSIIENAPKQRWYVGDATNYIYSIRLITDDGTEYVQGASAWCGCFESLVGAEIVEQPLPRFKYYE